MSAAHYAFVVIYEDGFVQATLTFATDETEARNGYLKETMDESVIKHGSVQQLKYVGSSPCDQGTDKLYDKLRKAADNLDRQTPKRQLCDARTNSFW